MNYLKQFLQLLPDDVPAPEVAAEDDGDIELSWMPKMQRTFSVSIGDSPRLPYAWMNGRDTGHGVAEFDGKEIPADLLDRLRYVVTYGTGPW